MTKKAQTKPIRGLATIGIATLTTRLFQCTPTPAASTPTPTTPPSNARDDDEAIPKYQVIRFHTLAPTRALPTIVKARLASRCAGNLSISALVFAPPTPSSAPKTF